MVAGRSTRGLNGAAIDALERASEGRREIGWEAAAAKQARALRADTGPIEVVVRAVLATAALAHNHLVASRRIAPLHHLFLRHHHCLRRCRLFSSTSPTQPAAATRLVLTSVGTDKSAVSASARRPWECTETGATNAPAPATPFTNHYTSVRPVSHQLGPPPTTAPSLAANVD